MEESGFLNLQLDPTKHYSINNIAEAVEQVKQYVSQSCRFVGTGRTHGELSRIWFDVRCYGHMSEEKIKGLVTENLGPGVEYISGGEDYMVKTRLYCAQNNSKGEQVFVDFTFVN